MCSVAEVDGAGHGTHRRPVEGLGLLDHAVEVEGELLAVVRGGDVQPLVGRHVVEGVDPGRRRGLAGIGGDDRAELGAAGAQAELDGLVVAVVAAATSSKRHQAT